MRRRQFLSAVGSAVGAAALGQAACTPEPAEPPRPVTLNLADLPDGEHKTVRMGGKPVDVVRRGDAVEARSLVCPHTGCLVRWLPADDRYRCACHDGLFDADGRVIGGQATGPLVRLPVQVSGTTVSVSPARPRAGLNTPERPGQGALVACRAPGTSTG